jgi:hypothetical protein
MARRLVSLSLIHSNERAGAAQRASDLLAGSCPARPGRPRTRGRGPTPAGTSRAWQDSPCRPGFRWQTDRVVVSEVQAVKLPADRRVYLRRRCPWLSAADCRSWMVRGPSAARLGFRPSGRRGSERHRRPRPDGAGSAGRVPQGRCKPRPSTPACKARSAEVLTCGAKEWRRSGPRLRCPRLSAGDRSGLL